MQLFKLFNRKSVFQFGLPKSQSTWKSINQQQQVIREEFKTPAKKDETHIIKEVRQLCHHSRIACAKVLHLMGELEKATEEAPDTSRKAYGIPRKQSDFSKQVARYSTKAEDHDDDDEDSELIKSDRDYCKEFDKSSKLGSKKRVSTYVKPIAPKVDPCGRKEGDATPLPEECLDGDEACESDLAEVSELPNVLEMYKDVVCEPTREMKDYFGVMYKNFTFYSFHRTSYYDLIEKLKDMRSDTYCSPQEIERRRNDTRDSRCLFVCEKRDPVLVKLCDLNDKKPVE